MGESEWPLYVVVPDGYEEVALEAATDPTERGEGYLGWETGE